MKVQTRKATMTNKERVEALLRREKPDRVPFYSGGGGFAMLYSGLSLADQFTKPLKVVYEAERKASQDFDWVFTPTLGGRRVRGEEFGAEVKLPTSQYSQAPYIVKFPAETPEEAMAFKMPDARACLTPEVLDFSRWVYQDEDDNKPYVTFGAFGGLGTVANIIGPEKVCKWMVKYPEVVHHLLRLATDRDIELAQYYRDTFGVERVIPTGGSPHASNQLISPKHFEQFLMPYLKEAHQKVLAMGFKHISHHPCGEHNLNLPYFQQVPMGDPGIWQIGDEIDLITMEKYFPNDIIEGNLNTATIQVGTPDEVYEAARKLIEKGKRLATGFMLKPACGLPPRAPLENMRAITRALNDFGWYD